MVDQMADSSATTTSVLADKVEPTVSAGSPSKQPIPTVQAHQQQPRPGQVNDSKVLKLKGLPYSTSENDIHNFFSGFQLTDVAFVYEPDGRPSGLAFAEFATRDEALQALSKNGEYLGDRYVRLLHVPKQEMEEQVRLGTLAIPGAQAKMRQKILRNSGAVVDSANPYADALHGGMLQASQQVMPELAAGGASYHSQLPGLVPQGAPHHSTTQPGVPHPLTSMNLGHMAPGAGMGAPSMLPANIPAADQHMQLPMGSQQGRLPGGMAGMLPHMALAYQLSGMGISSTARPGTNQMSMVQMMPHAYAPAAAAAAAPPAPPMAVIGTDSKTIKIRGLPFRATPLDIFNFFESYDVITESLQLGVDALGRPSGEAWLTFTSSEEALRAVRERNRHYLGNRYLELSLT